MPYDEPEEDEGELKRGAYIFFAFMVMVFLLGILIGHYMFLV